MTESGECCESTTESNGQKHTPFRVYAVTSIRQAKKKSDQKTPDDIDKESAERK